MIRKLAMMALFASWMCEGVWATTPHTIVVDANITDFASDEFVFDDSESDSAWDSNELSGLYVTWDRDNLYIGVDGYIEEQNSYSLYFDFGVGWGARQLETVAWEKSFRAVGWLCSFSVQCSGNGTFGSFYILGDSNQEDITYTAWWTGDFPIASDFTQYEVQIPFDDVYRYGIPPGASVGVFVGLTGYRAWDAGDGMPEQDFDTGWGNGVRDDITQLVLLTIDANGDSVPDDGWHPATNSGENGQPPEADASGTPAEGDAPLTVNFEGYGIDPDGGNVTYGWEFGDGGTSAEQSPSHVYSLPGDYLAVLTVTDDEGMPGTDGVTIRVHDPAQEDVPIQRLSMNNNRFQAGDWFALSTISTNLGPTTSVDQYILLDVYGFYYWFPTWTTAIASRPFTFTQGMDGVREDILKFTFPSPLDPAPGLFFYSACFEPGTLDAATIVGDTVNVAAWEIY